MSFDIPDNVLAAINTPAGMVAIDPTRVSELMHCISQQEVQAALANNMPYYRQRCQGMLAGFMAALVGIGWTAEKVVALCKRYTPLDYDPECLPLSWQTMWENCSEQPGA